MKKPLVSFVKELRTSKKIFTFDEASIKQAVVLRLLSLLEWDIFNVEEICPDFSSDASTVSFALRIDHAGKVLIDVKRDQEDADGFHKQLVDWPPGRRSNSACTPTARTGGSTCHRPRGG